MDADLDTTLNFCMVNLVLCELTYGGETRYVEGYSFKITKAGNRLFYAYCYKDNRINSFRMDRIEAAQATTHKYSPRWSVVP